MLPVDFALPSPQPLFGLVHARGLRVAPSNDALRELINAALREPHPDDSVKQSIRQMLRSFGFKPSGRSKPASEYLSGTALQGQFPFINNVVDINNLISMTTGLPASVIDLQLACPGGVETLQARVGQPSESFVFNRTGQTIDIEHLLCVGVVGGTSFATPVKDAAAVKVHESTTDVLAILYAPRAFPWPGALPEILERYALLLSKFTEARDAKAWIANP